MSKAKEFTKIMEISNSQKVVIVTEHYQITGEVYDCEDSSKEEFVNLTDASLCLLNNMYETQTCDRYSGTNYDWLHVNFDKIVAFSFIN